MKKTLPLSLLLFALVLSACKKDDSIKLNDVVGQYYLSRFIYYNDDNTIRHEANSNDIPCLRSIKFSLKADHTTASFNTGTGTCYIYYNSPSDKAIIDATDKSYNWELVNNAVQLNGVNGSQTETYTISRVSGKIQLEYYSNETDVVTIKSKSVFIKE